MSTHLSQELLDPCDYLVVGAGAASLAFVDTLLTEQPSTTVVIVDKHSAPGGHWNDAYDFVHLHQPSLLYGVASKPLEGSWLKLMLLKGMLPWNHRASKPEILKYYKEIVDGWVKSKRVRYFPNTKYDFSSELKSEESNVHNFEALDGRILYRIKANVKLVNGIAGECKVPSTCPLEFPVDHDVPVLTPNDLFRVHEAEKVEKAHSPRMWRRSVHCETKRTKYVVLGCGKTGMDAVVYLQQVMRVDSSDICWIVPNDVWMLNRSGSGGGPWSYANALLDSDLDVSKACHELEDQGIFVRLDKAVEPTRFRFPVIGKDELRLMRQVKNVIRQGRVTSISVQPDGGYRLEFDRSDEPVYISDDHVFIHCASPGPFNGTKVHDLFVSDKMMNLYFLYAPPVPISMSCLAALESAQRNGTLDVDFGRRLLGADESMSENEVLRRLVHGYVMTNVSPKDHLAMLVLLGVFLGLLNTDPMIARQWMAKNRLSFFSIPGFKSNIYERIRGMSKNYKLLGFDKTEARMLGALADKLGELKGT